MKKLILIPLLLIAVIFTSIFINNDVYAYIPPDDGEIYKVLHSDYVSYWNLETTYTNDDSETVNLYEVWIDLPNYTDDWVVFNNVFTITTSSLVENIMISYRIVGLGFNSFNYITGQDYLNAVLTSGVYAKVTSDSNAFLKVDNTNQGVDYLSQVNYKYYSNLSDVKLLLYATIKGNTPQNENDLISYLSSTGLDSLYFYKGFVADIYTNDIDSAYADGYRQGKNDGIIEGTQNGYDNAQSYYGIRNNGDWLTAEQWGTIEYSRGLQSIGGDSYNIQGWIVPAIIVVLFLGGAISIISKKREG